jgi:hypothetical protein
LILNHLVDADDEYVLVDMTAGADAFASGLFTRFDRTFVVCEPTVRAVGVYRQYLEYAADYQVAVSAVSAIRRLSRPAGNCSTSHPSCVTAEPAGDGGQQEQVRVDVLLLAGQFAGTSHGQALRDAVSYALAAERAGFDGVWIAERPVEHPQAGARPGHRQVGVPRCPVPRPRRWPTPSDRPASTAAGHWSRSAPPCSAGVPSDRRSTRPSRPGGSWPSSGPTAWGSPPCSRRSSA